MKKSKASRTKVFIVVAIALTVILAAAAAYANRRPQPEDTWIIPGTSQHVIAKQLMISGYQGAEEAINRHGCRVIEQDSRISITLIECPAKNIEELEAIKADLENKQVDAQYNYAMDPDRLE
jgi:hypothetical protein